MTHQEQRDRKDHYVPRGYLKGFIDPARENLSKPFWKLDLATKQWSMASPGSVGWKRGFYDYAEFHPDLKNPDETFKQLENDYPSHRDEVLRKNYKDWVKQHKAFFLRYMQMMRARSPLFINHQTEQNRTLRGATVTSVGPGNKITVDSLELRPLSEKFIRNRTITQMNEEIQKGPDWMWSFHWCLRYTRDVNDPFVTADHPLIVNGVHSDLAAGIQRGDTLIFFPLCWQACLVGSRDRFDVGTDQAHPHFLRQFRALFARSTNGYVISPHKLDDQQFIA